jgi:hypothetical protein
MQGEDLERWRELCVLAAAEQDPDRLLALIREINTLLGEKERHLKNSGRAEPNNLNHEACGLHLCRSNCR